MTHNGVAVEDPERQPGMITMVVCPDRTVQFQITDGENILHTMQFTTEEAVNLAFAILHGLVMRPLPPEVPQFDA